MTEMIVIGAIALLVVGPKDLPKVFKGIASLMRQVRKLTREFQGVVDDMIRDSDLDDLRKEATDLRNSIDPTLEIREAMKDVENDVRETSNAVDSGASWQATASPASETKPETTPVVAAPAAKTPAKKAAPKKAAAKTASAPKATTSKAATAKTSTAKAAASKPKPKPKPRAQSKPAAAAEPAKSGASS